MRIQITSYTQPLVTSVEQLRPILGYPYHPITEHSKPSYCLAINRRHYKIKEGKTEYAIHIHSRRVAHPVSPAPRGQANHRKFDASPSSLSAPTLLLTRLPPCPAIDPHHHQIPYHRIQSPQNPTKIRTKTAAARWRRRRYANAGRGFETSARQADHQDVLRTQRRVSQVQDVQGPRGWAPRADARIAGPQHVRDARGARGCCRARTSGGGCWCFGDGNAAGCAASGSSGWWWGRGWQGKEEEEGQAVRRESRSVGDIVKTQDAAAIGYWLVVDARLDATDQRLG